MGVLITGANGFLGQSLSKLLLEQRIKVIATGRGGCRLPFYPSKGLEYASMDLTDVDVIEKNVDQYQPSVIVHAAAMSRPNDCESQKELAYNVNVKGTEYLLESARKHDAFFVFISTDFVFDGEKGMYNETDKPNPVNYYGQTKLEAEKLVQSYINDWSIIRTILVYGKPVTGSSNILTVVKSKLEKGEEYSVVNDQFRTPTYVDDLAKGIIAVIDKKATGIYHISGEEMITPYEMASRVADHFGYDKGLLKEVNASGFPEPALRPPRTGFNIEKAKKELGYHPIPFEEGLRLTFDPGMKFK